MMLAAHAPYPALALDRAWNVLLSNQPFDSLTTLLGADIWERVGAPETGSPRNLMRLFFHPQGIRPFVTNWSAVGPLLWQRATREAHDLGGAEMQAVLDGLASFQDPEVLWSAADAALLPVVPFALEVGDARISLFAVVATFGTAQDVDDGRTAHRDAVSRRSRNRGAVSEYGGLSAKDRGWRTCARQPRLRAFREISANTDWQIDRRLAPALDAQENRLPVFSLGLTDHRFQIGRRGHWLCSWPKARCRRAAGPWPPRLPNRRPP